MVGKGYFDTDQSIPYILCRNKEGCFNDETKIKILSKNIMQDDESSAAAGYAAQAKAGDVFYVKLPAKMNTKVFLSPGVIKDGFTSMKDRVGYFESGKGTTVYHTFSLNKRAEIEFTVFAEYKNQIIFSKDTVGGGYKFSIYKKGKKKAIKTVKVTKNNKNKKITLPKQKGIYYVRVSKLTNKTNGLYKIEDDTY